MLTGQKFGLKNDSNFDLISLSLLPGAYIFILNLYNLVYKSGDLYVMYLQNSKLLDNICSNVDFKLLFNANKDFLTKYLEVMKPK